MKFSQEVRTTSVRCRADLHKVKPYIIVYRWTWFGCVHSTQSLLCTSADLDSSHKAFAMVPPEDSVSSGTFPSPR